MYSKIIETIKQYDVITVFRHENPDADALGSQFGLVEIIKTTYPNKQVFALGRNSVSLSGKVFPESDEVSDEIIAKSLALIVDTANKERVDDKRYLLAKETIKIDHHPARDQYATLINYVDTSAAATCEILTDLLMQNCDELKTTKQGYTYLYTGLVTDTGRFLFNSTTERTFNLASFLIKTGINIQNIYNNLYIRSFKEAKLTGYILDKAILTDGHVGYYFLEEQDYEHLQIPFDLAKDAVNTLSNIEEMEVWISFTKNPYEGFYHVSLRSRKIIINDIAEAFGGGGHPFASGIKASSIERCMSIIAAVEAKIAKEVL